MRIASRVILLEEGKLALIECTEPGEDTFYVFPGGQVEDGETIAEAAAREAFEELGIHVQVQRLQVIYERMNYVGFFFWASRIDGKLGTGSGPEFCPQNNIVQYKAKWVSFAKLPMLNVHPKELVLKICSKEISPDSPILYIAASETR